MYFISVYISDFFYRNQPLFTAVVEKFRPALFPFYALKTNSKKKIASEETHPQIKSMNGLIKWRKPSRCLSDDDDTPLTSMQGFRLAR